MFHLLPTDTLDLPELSPYRTMRRPVQHEAQGIFVAEGILVVRRLLECESMRIVSVLMPEDRLSEFESLLRSRTENIPVYVISNKKLLEQLVGFSMFQGVMAVGRIPTPPTLDEVLAACSKPRLFVAMDELCKSENVGVVIRNCAAFGVHAVVIGETSASPYLRRAVRNSMGNVFYLPMVNSCNLVETLFQLRDHGVRCIAAHPHESGRTLTDTDFTGDSCIVVGGEAEGLRPAVLDACNEAVAIPMPPNVDSLNVSNASAVFLYEACRQRGRFVAQRISC